MPLLAFAFGLLPSPRDLWRFFTSPPGLCVLAALAIIGAWIAGDVHGARRMTAVYEQRIAESIQKNAEFDKNLREEMAAKSAEERATADQRVAAAEQKVVEYEEKFQSCTLGDRGADFLNGDGVPAPGRVIPKPPRPPRRP